MLVYQMTPLQANFHYNIHKLPILSHPPSLFLSLILPLSLSLSPIQAVCKELDAIAELMHSNEEDSDVEEHNTK